MRKPDEQAAFYDTGYGLDCFFEGVGVWDELKLTIQNIIPVIRLVRLAILLAKPRNTP